MSKVNVGKAKCIKCGELSTVKKVSNSTDYYMRCVSCGYMVQFKRKVFNYIKRNS
jgi:DNA-directed RNA polymerase subunit RPC12/RpoP